MKPATVSESTAKQAAEQRYLLQQIASGNDHKVAALARQRGWRPELTTEDANFISAIRCVADWLTLPFSGGGE